MNCILSADVVDPATVNSKAIGRVHGIFRFHGNKTAVFTAKWKVDTGGTRRQKSEVPSVYFCTQHFFLVRSVHCLSTGDCTSMNQALNHSEGHE